jgi:hypothetical protein
MILSLPPPPPQPPPPPPPPPLSSLLSSASSLHDTINKQDDAMMNVKAKVKEPYTGLDRPLRIPRKWSSQNL